MQHNKEDDAPLSELWNISESYKSNYEPNVEKGLAALKAKIAKESRLPTTKAKVVPMRRRLWLGRIAASVVFLLVSTYLFNTLTNSTPELQQITTTDGLMEDIHLPDGSRVWVNKNSELTYPKSFEGTTRTVSLKGEAFFQVAKNQTRPFIVKTEDGEVKVLGTAFNVRAYSEEDKTTVEVAEGKVAFQIANLATTKILSTNDKITYDKESATFSSMQALDWKEVAWKEQHLKFEDEPIQEVLAYLNYNFGLKVNFDQEKLRNCPLNASFVKNQPETILKKIKSAFPNIQLKKVQLTEYELSGSCD